MSSREIEFLGTLGSGGFGVVYLANLREGELLRRVAVKVMRDAATGEPEIVARQRDEARLLALLNHHAIVRVETLFELRGRPAVLMELVEGVDVGAVLKVSGKPLPLAVAVNVVATVASALDAAWSTPGPRDGKPLHVVHRDIKPPNIVLTASGAVKVLDFGIARADFDREGVTSSHAFGTPRYMAPEHFSGAELGHSYDVYALGVSFWEMAVGRSWERPSLHEPAFRATVAERVAESPEGVRELLASMLDFDAAARPAAAQVHEILEGLRVDGERPAAFARRVVAPMAKERKPDTSMGVPSRFSLDASLAVGDETAVSLGTAPAARVTWTIAAAAVGLVLVVTLAAIAGGAAWWIVREEHAPVEVAAMEPVPVSVGEPAPDPVLAAEAPPAVPDPPPPASAPARRAARPADDNAAAREALVREATTPAPKAAAPAAPPPATKEVVAAPTRAITIAGERRDLPVLLDGANAGLTPLRVELADGAHSVEVRYPEGAVTGAFTVSATSADTYKCSLETRRCTWKSR